MSRKQASQTPFASLNISVATRPRCHMHLNSPSLLHPSYANMVVSGHITRSRDSYASVPLAHQCDWLRTLNTNSSPAATYRYITLCLCRKAYRQMRV